jgi:hypothetical protein
MHDDLIRLKNMMGGFSKYSYGVRSILAEVSQNQSLRSAGKDPSVQTTIDATINLRAWIVDKYQVIRSSGPSPLQRVVPGMGEGENEDYGDENLRFMDGEIDSQGNVYLMGTVYGSYINAIQFTTANAIQPIYGGGTSDAFLVKINHVYNYYI